MLVCVVEEREEKKKNNIFQEAVERKTKLYLLAKYCHVVCSLENRKVCRSYKIEVDSTKKKRDRMFFHSVFIKDLLQCVASNIVITTLREGMYSS